jgi:hypothetical protein
VAISPEDVQALDGRIYAIHDGDRHGDGEIVLDVFTERDFPVSP